MQPKSVVILGSTGSVGRQTLQVVRALPQYFRIMGLCARADVETLFEQIATFDPDLVVMTEKPAFEKLRNRLPTQKQDRLKGGMRSMVELACDPRADVVVVALSGHVGLESVLAAVRASKHIALANKESLVMAGDLIMRATKRYQATLLPIDSEHAAVAQLLESLEPDQIRRVILTASGGPFRGKSEHQLETVDVASALAHPNWKMGSKVSVDSASMMNKGFELLEAQHLFGLQPDQLDVLIHPESIVHALVERVDGSVFAQMASPDMRLPIAWALGKPKQETLAKLKPRLEPLRLDQIGRLTFEKATESEYPALALCRQALRLGGGAAAALSVADEVVVQAFLQGDIPFRAILRVLARVLNLYQPQRTDNLESVLQAGRQGGRLAAECLAQWQADAKR